MSLRTQNINKKPNLMMGGKSPLTMTMQVKKDPVKEPVKEEKEKSNLQLMKDASKLPTDELYDWFKEWIEDLEECDSD